MTESDSDGTRAGNNPADKLLSIFEPDSEPEPMDEAHPERVFPRALESHREKAKKQLRSLEKAELEATDYDPVLSYRHEPTI